MKLTTLSKGSVYRLVGKRQFPAPLKLSDERIAWRVSSIARWMSEREHAT
jgi:predicted DNA-binding transcriptional regulator AlpA